VAPADNIKEEATKKKRTYENELKYLKFQHVMLEIQNDSTISFSSYYREELNAIRKCFTNHLQKNCDLIIQEHNHLNVLNIEANKMPEIPPFDQLIPFFIKLVNEKVVRIERAYPKTNFLSLKTQRIKLNTRIKKNIKNFKHYEYVDLRQNYKNTKAAAKVCLSQNYKNTRVTPKASLTANSNTTHPCCSIS
tara:strand:- start:166 stop:741 length:576 start_codon:yes stop_codon:yes gene_type:complete